MSRAHQLRALIRNDRMLVAHYVLWLRQSPEAPLPADRDRIIASMHAVIARLQARRAERRALLGQHTFPAAPAPNATLAGALVTTSAAQPGISS